VWLAYAGRSVTDKVVALLFPVSPFIAAGFEVFPAFGMVDDADRQFSGRFRRIGRHNGASFTILCRSRSATLGGAGLVGAMYWAIYRSSFGNGGKSDAAS
jgi:formate transporter